jgi:hypothetical protein
MKGHLFSKYIPNQNQGSLFDQLLNLFLQMMQYTNGDVAETLEWMNEVDREHKFTNSEYGMGNFIQDLKDKGYVKENPAVFDTLESMVYSKL